MRYCLKWPPGLAQPGIVHFIMFHFAKDVVLLSGQSGLNGAEGNLHSATYPNLLFPFARAHLQGKGMNR